MTIELIPARRGMTTIRAVYTGTGEDHGKTFTWKAYRCTASRYWVLMDWMGYERYLEKTWTDSVPIIQRIIENHGMTAKIS
jgi:hypothetical protein